MKLQVRRHIAGRMDGSKGYVKSDNQAFSKLSEAKRRLRSLDRAEFINGNEISHHDIYDWDSKEVVYTTEEEK